MLHIARSFGLPLASNSHSTPPPLEPYCLDRLSSLPLFTSLRLAPPSQLANSLAQNCGKPLQLELGSRAFTGTLDRLINDRTTNPKIKQRALHFVKMWRDEFGHDPASGTINELYEGLKAKGIVFDDKVKQGSGSGSGGRGGGGGGGAGGESDAERRTREEEEELQRVLELSKQDKGGRGTSSANTQSTGVGSSSSGTGSSSQPQALTASPNPGGPGGTATTTTISSPGPKPFPAHTHEPTPAPLPSKETASRVRAIYPFVTSEKGELAFEKDQVIKVIDRMYDEWYTGAVGGRIGIFPISYVVSIARERLQIETAFFFFFRINTTVRPYSPNPLLLPSRMIFLRRNLYPTQPPKNSHEKLKKKPESSPPKE